MQLLSSEMIKYLENVVEMSLNFTAVPLTKNCQLSGKKPECMDCHAALAMTGLKGGSQITKLGSSVETWFASKTLGALQNIVIARSVATWQSM